MHLRRKNIILLFCFLALLTGCAAPQPEDSGTASVATAEEMQGTTTEADVSETSPETEPSEPEQEQTAAQSEEYFAEPEYVTVAAFPTEATYAEWGNEATPYELTLVSEEPNNCSDYDQWLTEHDFAQAMAGYTITDENYIYGYSYDNSSLTDKISITDLATGEPLYLVKFEERMGDVWDFMGWAYCEDGVLYTTKCYNGYASANTCYLMAIDLATGELLWRSEDQTCNAHNFIVKGDVILCCYGFTAEPDYLYQIDKHTGKVLSRTDLAKMGDYLVEQDGMLYIHGYDRDYVFQITEAAPSAQTYLDSDGWTTYLSYVNDTEGYLLFCSSPGAGLMEKQLFYTDDAGVTYSYIGDLSDLISGYPQGIAATQYGTLFIPTTYHGDDTYLYGSSDGGETWSSVEVLASREGISYVDCYVPTFDGDTGEIVLKVVTTDTISYQLYTTDDAGKSWTYETDVEASPEME